MVWLKSFKLHVEDSMLLLCRFAYDQRGTPSMKELTERSFKGSAYADTEDSNASKFAKLRHFIGRLGSHMKAAKVLVAAATRFPALFTNFQIECCASPKLAETPPPIDARTTLDAIVIRMLPKDHERVPFYQEKLRNMDNKFGIHKRLVREYENSNFLPRVHAELILLEHFHMRRFVFVDGDKYIGCSKPACYCCYHYICAHPGGFVRPASHNKSYLYWRPPDVADDDLEGQRRRRDIVNEMLKEIRRSVLEQIEEQGGRRPGQYDSTTGISTSVKEASHILSSLVLDDSAGVSRSFAFHPQNSEGHECYLRTRSNLQFAGKRY
jgi:hypothetical protein